LALPTKNLILGLYLSEIPGMINKIAFSIIFTAVLGTCFAQTSEPATKTGRPDIPGTFVMEFGFNRDLTGPDNFSLHFWGSRTVNFYYQYDLRIANSKFSLVPGIGVSLERYTFKKYRTFVNYNDSLRLLAPNERIVANSDTIRGMAGVRNSKLITNFVDIPVELRFTSNPDDPARAFKVAIGGRVGYLLDSFAKVKYKEDGEMKKLKDKQDFNLNKLRYGVSARIGYGNFSIFAYYNLTDLFEKNKGVYYQKALHNYPTGTIGISLSSF
jgi:hypothetical protein